MSIYELTQNEADYLFEIAKGSVANRIYLLPGPGKQLHIPVRSIDLKHEFMLDVRSGRIELKKGTCQLRTASEHVLVRIDLAGGIHRNPDGKELACPHIHLYREGYNDQWAYPLPAVFSKPDDLRQTLDDFLEYCNIINKPCIERGSML